ncbi:Flp pilus assembly complex ATPase component TadA, partial [Candidatus Uhrbacteria bacterium]|nr:Flp pilus assembly complex ATPase component TadA [Candidatus Uhrbacteria bacterium]
DEETARIAIHAALTGHFVLSTLHTNDAPGAIARLTGIGVEPFLVASSVNAVIAQRLVRKICEKCRKSSRLDDKELKYLKAEPRLAGIVAAAAGRKDFSKMTFYRGAGCPVCGHTGYAGRTGIFEVMEVTEEIRPLITIKAASHEIDARAKKLGMVSMLRDGLAKALQGITTFDEVVRATKT